jgi:hypothetical protein
MEQLEEPSDTCSWKRMDQRIVTYFEELHCPSIVINFINCYYSEVLVLMHRFGGLDYCQM